MGMRWMSGRGHTLPALLIEAQEEEKGPLPEAKGLTCLPADLPLGWGLVGGGVWEDCCHRAAGSCF